MGMARKCRSFLIRLSNSIFNVMSMQTCNTYEQHHESSYKFPCSRFQLFIDDIIITWIGISDVDKLEMLYCFNFVQRLLLFKNRYFIARRKQAPDPVDISIQKEFESLILCNTLGNLRENRLSSLFDKPVLLNVEKSVRIQQLHSYTDSVKKIIVNLNSL